MSWLCHTEGCFGESHGGCRGWASPWRRSIRQGRPPRCGHTPASYGSLFLACTCCLGEMGLSLCAGVQECVPGMVALGAP